MSFHQFALSGLNLMDGFERYCYAFILLAIFIRLIRGSFKRSYHNRPPEHLTHEGRSYTLHNGQYVANDQSGNVIAAYLLLRQSNHANSDSEATHRPMHGNNTCELPTYVVPDQVMSCGINTDPQTPFTTE